MNLEYLNEKREMGSYVCLRNIKKGDLFMVLYKYGKYGKYGKDIVYRAINSFNEGMGSLYMEVEVRTPHLKFEEGDKCWFTKETCHPDDVVMFIENQS